MKSRSPVFSIILTLLTTLILVMLVYIVFRFTQTNKLPAPTVQPGGMTTQPVDPGRAFIKIVTGSGVADIGGEYSIVLDSNEWAKCTVDLYEPGEVLFQQTKDQARANPLAPGRFNWTWKVPMDAQGGAWLARVLCGSAENLATLDQSIEVR
ncbi:MAG: hypothetical protein WC787_00380 [Patescibacteria group bacterium]|jgi:hypothetical protein